VSRTVAREAIKVLAAKGLVVSRQKVGTRVLPRDQWNLFDPDVGVLDRGQVVRSFARASRFLGGPAG
jgi:DNA-binding FadR family transcriptional regulator